MSPRRRGGPPRRGASTSTQRLELLVFVEGRQTEEQYLKHWHRLHRDNVLVTVDNFRGDPLALVEHARNAQKHEARDARRGRGRPHDQIWCVFDRDEHERYAAAIDLAANIGINLAISNPCIELWFLLHFQDQTAYLDRGEAQRVAKRCLGCDKVLTPAALDMLVERYDDAARRARFLNKKHAGDGSSSDANPSSNVWRLIDIVRSASTT